MNQLELGRRSSAVRVIGSIIRVGGSQKSEFFWFRSVLMPVSIMSDWIWYAAANRQQGPVHALFTSFYLQWAALLSNAATPKWRLPPGLAIAVSRPEDSS